jgi:hypothetical protein
MKLISHRGNIFGPSKEENNPSQIEHVISLGYDVEVDVWKYGSDIYLGHDYPKYNISFNFLSIKGLWCHAKNLESLNSMIAAGFNCFWHQGDDYTITSTGVIWTYPNKPVCESSVIVCQSLNNTLEMSKAPIYGICSDFVGEVK